MIFKDKPLFFPKCSDVKKRKKNWLPGGSLYIEAFK